MPFQFGKLLAAPAPPPPPPFLTPTEPSAPTFGGTQRTATTNAELDTALNLSVDGDLIYIPQNTTIVLESRKTISASVKLYGQNQSSSVISTVDDYGKVSWSDATKLSDYTKSWTVNQWANGYAAFSFAGATLQARIIVSNSVDTLVYAGASVATTNLGYTIRKVIDSNPVTAATTTVVTDSTKNWTTNRFAGCYVLIGTQLRQITSSTATTFTVSAAFSPAPTVGSTYSIFFDVPANSGALIVSGTKNGVLNNNVMFSSMTVSSPSNAVDHACISAPTLSSQFNNGITGLLIDGVKFNHTEWGVSVAADSWVIKNCTFNYVPQSGASDNYRDIMVYNIGTMGWIADNVFNATTDATPRDRPIFLTTSNYAFAPDRSGGFSGDLVVQYNTAYGNLNQFLNMEVIKANGLNTDPMVEHGFSVWLNGNTTPITSGGTVILYEGSGTKAPLNFFDVIYTSGNTAEESTGTDKGFIAVDGLGALRSAGAPNHLYVAAANSGTAFTAPLGGAYVQGSTTTGLLAVNGTYFNSPGPNSLVTVEQV